MSQIRPIPRDGNPFPGHGVWVDEHGTRHYDNIPATLLDSLQRWADRTPDAEASGSPTSSCGTGQHASPAGSGSAEWAPATGLPCVTRRASTGCSLSGAP
jgi:hypothetical protein